MQQTPLWQRALHPTRLGLAAVIGLSCIALTGCFFPPTPWAVQVGGMPMRDIRARMLSMRDAWDYPELTQGMCFRLRKVSRYEDPEAFTEWQAASQTMRDVIEKASHGWPSLKKSDRYPGMAMKDYSSEQVVLAETYETVAVLANEAPGAVRSELIALFDGAKPTDATLLARWNEANGDLRR